MGVIPEVAAGAQVLRRLRGKGIALLTDQDSVRPFATSWDYLRPPKAQMTERSRAAGGANPSASFLGRREAPSGVPAVFGRVHLTGTPSAFGEGPSSAIREISAPPRPIPPHPRWRYPYYPPGYGCYACGFDFGFGFGLPLFYFGYWNWSPPFWHSSTQSTASMLLYMQDGSAFEVTDYWVDGDILDYVTVDGTNGSFARAQLWTCSGRLMPTRG